MSTDQVIASVVISIFLSVISFLLGTIGQCGVDMQLLRVSGHVEAAELLGKETCR